MHPSDPACEILGIPLEMHTSSREVHSAFEREEKMYRRHPAGNLSIKSLINFEDMSVNRQKFSTPSQVLINCDDGTTFANCGVASFPAKSVLDLQHTMEVGPEEKRTFDVKIKHEPDRCNFSHSCVQSQEGGQNKGLPKLVKKLFRKKVSEFARREIPVEFADLPMNLDVD